MTKTMAADSRGRIEAAFRPVTPTIGATVSGLDVRELDADSIRFVRSAILKSRVVFIRKQHLDADAFLRFAELLGPTTRHHPHSTRKFKVSDGASSKARSNVWERDNTYRSDHWHTDVTFIDRPVAFTLLRCIETPAIGGDTLFADTVAAYERLPEPLRRLADVLRVVHSSGAVYRQRMMWEKEDMDAFVTEHPLVRVHSETGERSLVLGSFAEQIVGLTPAASVGLIRIIQDYVTMPENLVRWHWEPGDLAIWDNRATQHYAVDDYGDAPRLMQRLTVAGGVPVGVDGQTSKVIRGDASEFSVLGPA